MPVGFVAALIAIAVIAWGIKLHREEMETGAEARGFNWFLILTVGPGFVVWLWFLDHPFLGDLIMTLTGLLMGGGVVFLAGHFARLLRQARQRQQSHPGDQ